MRAKAFSPAHITGFFKAELEEKDLNQLGSLGAGFSIKKGVKTTVNVRPKTKQQNRSVRKEHVDTVFHDINISYFENS